MTNSNISAFAILLVVTLWSAASADLSWWQKSVFYQIYPRSFQDSDNDGIGDLKGIIERVDYLKDLGVNGIWMNPIYDSPMNDFGYDISNYTSIDKTFGTLQDLKTLIDKLHNQGMYILMDIVLNHSSDEHPWFQKSIRKIEPYTDYYIWHDGKTGNSNRSSVPNNWESVFGGPAWHWHDARRQYYYHAFLSQQPDLNYRNPNVVNEMKKVLKFWLDLGVDGFRVDAVPYLVEDEKLTNEPPIKQSMSNFAQTIYTQNRPEGYAVLQELYSVVQNYENEKYPGEKIFVLEAYADIKTLQNYFKYNGRKTSTMPFNFALTNINRQTNGSQIKMLVDLWTNNLIPGGWSNWVIGNHDLSRVGKKVGIPMTDGMNMINLLLPGTPFCYYGEELGMDDTYIPCYDIQDIQAINQGGGDCDKMERLTRDCERTPMQWNDSSNAGFSNHKPWLPLNPNYYTHNVQLQKTDARSHLNIFKSIILLKKEAERCKDLKTLDAAKGWVFAFKRSSCENTNIFVVIVNFSNQDEVVDVSKKFNLDEMYIRISSRNSNKRPGQKIFLSNLKLRPKEALVLSTVPS